jgi:hypothetical protein
MVNRNLDKAIDSVHKKIVDLEANSSNMGYSIPPDTEEHPDQKIYQIGKAAHDYEWNLKVLNNEISNATDEEIETAKQQIEWYEKSYIATAKANALKAGESPEIIDEYSKQCKEHYEDWLHKELKNVKTVIHTDGTMTVTNTRTGEVGRFDNNFNPIE